jgi:hypothetical protein
MFRDPRTRDGWSIAATKASSELADAWDGHEPTAGGRGSRHAPHIYVGRSIAHSRGTDDDADYIACGHHWPTALSTEKP